jgi:hypothetical protein
MEIPSYTVCALNAGKADKNCLYHDTSGPYISATLNNYKTEI